MTISIAQFQIFFLVLSRIMSMIIHVPVLGGQSVPNTVKIGIGVFLAILMTPAQHLAVNAASLSSVAFGLALGREILVGTLAGFAAAMTFGCLQMAGHLFGLGSGFSSGNIINPALGDSGSSLDQIFLITAMLIFLALNGHQTFILGIQRTFTILPVNGPLPTLTFEPLIRITADLIRAGVQLSLPVMGVLLLTDLTLGLLTRVAPQVHVFFLGIPLKIGVGLLALALSLSVITPNLANLFKLLTPRALQLLGG